MVTDWEVNHAGDLPSEVWEILKAEGFMGMIIPEEYGGLGFSAAAHSAVVQKLATRCTALCVTVMVPNSLGPAELLLHYGTKEQKDRWLPRLARGEEIPCFALTEPNAGSDAGAMRSTGVVCEGHLRRREGPRHAPESGTSGTSRWRRSPACSAWPSSSATPRVCSARRRTWASPAP